MTDKIEISADFPYQSHYVDVLGSKIHYIDEGHGDPILFLHGIPTSCYLWRNVIPHLSSHGRCIAPDLIGMGKSDKPEIQYTIFDHINYVKAFIEALKLKNVTLVLHGWGSVIGFEYAMNHLKNVKGVAFLESYLRPETENIVSLLMQQAHLFLVSPKQAYEKLMHSDECVDHLLLDGVMRRLSEEELSAYREPFAEMKHRRPLWQYLQELPVGEEPKEITTLIRNYSQKLVESQLPKLMLYGVPGFQATIDTVQWAKDHLKKLTLVDLGETLHYPQETDPVGVGKAIANWYQGI